MPLYEYVCETHGLFKALRPMEEYGAPCACPSCGAPSQRVLLTPPRLGSRDRARMQAHAVNERSSDSPKRLSEHGPGCSCCSGGAKSARSTLVRPDGAKSFPSARPWMISH